MAEHSKSIDVTVSAVDGMVSESLELFCSYLLTRNLDDLDRGVRCARDVLALVFPHILATVHLGRLLLRRFQHTGHFGDLTEALQKFRHALQLVENDDYSWYEHCCAYLSIAYLERDGNLDALLELNVPHEYIEYYIRSKPSIETLTQNLGEHGEVCTYVLDKIDFDRQRFDQGRMVDGETAIQLCRQALAYFSSSFYRRGEILAKLGLLLAFKFCDEHELEDITEAVKCCDISLELGSPNSGEFWFRRSITSDVYLMRYKALGRREDLEKAVRLAKEAVEVIEMKFADLTQDTEFAFCLHSLSCALYWWYIVTEDANDVHAAIDAASRAVDIAESDADSKRRDLLQLASCVQIRFTKSGRAEDMVESIDIAKRALNYLPREDPGRLNVFCLLLNIEYRQSMIVQDQNYFDRGREYLREICYIREVNPGLKQLIDLGLLKAVSDFLLWSHCNCIASDDIFLDVTQFGSTEGRAIDAAIDMARICASNNQGAMVYQLALSDCLYEKWVSNGDIKDLDEAISTARRAIQLAEARVVHSRRLVEGQWRLGRCLHCRFKCTGDNDSREEALLVLLEGFRTRGFRSDLVIIAGKETSDILIGMADWDNAHKLSWEIIDFMVNQNSRSQAWPHKEFLGRIFYSRAATYASVALLAGSNVLEVIDILETSRGSILGHLIDKRADLDELTEAAPEKARLFKALQDEISTEIGPATNSSTRLNQINRRIEAEGELRACLEEIRSLKGFHQFLRGPTETELKAAAAQGPIIIVNVSALRSDAIIITKDAFNILELLELKQETVQMYIDKGLTDFSFETIGPKNREYRQFLEWLWDKCVKLILEKLKGFGYAPANFHVWWMGVGVANFLPFHAAGKDVRKAERESALFRIISSYTPTLRVLIHSQQKLKGGRLELAFQRVTMEQQTANIQPRLTLITMPSTPGRRNLDGVQHEATGVKDIVGKTFSTQIFVQPSVKDTLAHMAECEIVHFACHGESDFLNPSGSHLLLQTTATKSITPAVDKLTLRDVVDADLGHGKLAFLSACSSAQNRLKELQDEILHLVSGFQVAGYLHAIGNLWASDDKMSAELVKGFYKHLVETGNFSTGDNVAEALNKAVLGLAKKHPKDPLSWAQFVHFGT